jgi:hypothetical protein
MRILRAEIESFYDAVTFTRFRLFAMGQFNLPIISHTYAMMIRARNRRVFKITRVENGKRRNNEQAKLG